MPVIKVCVTLAVFAHLALSLLLNVLLVKYAEIFIVFPSK